MAFPGSPVRSISPPQKYARVLHAATGDYRRCEFRFAAARDDMGDVCEWIGAVTDVDDRYRSEQRERAVADPEEGSSP